MNKVQAKKLIFFFGLIIIICIAIIMKREDRSHKSPLNLSKLPSFRAIDIKGREIKSVDFKGKNTYIQFINPLFPPDLILFETVYTNWASEDIFFLGILSHSSIEAYKEKFQPDRVTFVEKDYVRLGLRFSISNNNGFYFLVDKNGMIINAGQNDLGYERGPKVFLNKLIKGDSFSISELISDHINIADIPWFSQVSDFIKNHNDKDYFIVSLFTKICDSCSGGSIIRALNKIDSNKNRSFIILLILNKNFDRKDIPNLKLQLNISCPVIIANNRLNAKWDVLIERYREDFLTDVVFIVDKSGKILNLAHRTCQCLPSFFKFVNSLMTESK